MDRALTKVRTTFPNAQTICFKKKDKTTRKKTNKHMKL